ncbi:conjugative transfer system coupling protein TraD [Photorhabdus sp. APURE]|uniref:conjugative transfer system coupling protein TraD n=1 Tax=Photorhabdus aballayi TaxID=2991723 RepID=UPI00223CFC22|nr:conjugative transfer system coupling protein TraD [Photorhabdus aballayi]MCW7549272.1 conjugative transfer system coupling protein TraD [Photorhabdus aballayi]
MSEWNYNIRWRPNFEAMEVAGWTTGIVAALGVNTYLNMPSMPCYLAVAVQAAYGIRTLPSAWDIYTHKRRLKRKPSVLKLNMDSFIDAMIKHPDSYLLGYGFEWSQNEGQLAFELIKRDIKKFVGKTPENFMGLGWIHALGKTQDWIRVSEDLLSLHTLITGTTGSGKTTYFKLMILQAALKKQPLILIDPKNDEELADWMHFCLKLVGCSEKFNYMSLAHPEKSARISPITNYTRAGEVANRITSVIQRSDGTSDPFVSFGTMSLTTVVELMKICEIKPTLKNVKSQLGSDISSLAELLVKAITKEGRKVLGENDFDLLFTLRMERYANKVKGPKEVAEICAEIYRNDIKPNRSNPSLEAGLNMLSHQREHFQKMILNVMPILSQLTQGFMTELLSPDSEDEDQLNDTRPISNVRDIITTGGMLYLGLDSLADAETGSATGSIFLSDITSVSADVYNFMKPRGDDLSPVMVLIDEAAEVINDQVIKMLNKTRGAGFRLFISSQSTSDFEARLGSEAKMKQVITNTNHFTALRTPDPDAQEAVMKRVPPTKFRYLMRGHGSNAGADPEMISGNVAERLMEEEGELFQSQLLGWLPNLEFMAINQANKIVKGKVPIIIPPKSNAEFNRVSQKAKKYLALYEKKVRGEKSRIAPGG